MFETVSKGFRGIKNRLQGKRELTEDNLKEILKEIRMSLLEADVNYHVSKRFLKRVKERTLGEVVRVKAKTKGGKTMKVSPGQHFIKICQDELENLMGPVDEQVLTMASGRTPTQIMMVGLQGSGKTTTTGKLAYWLMQEFKAKPLMVACDVYRPAAVKQLQVLGEQVGATVYADLEGDPIDIAAAAYRKARNEGFDFVIYDTAGRLAVDDILMSELEDIVGRNKPENVFLVVDAMIGRDAVNTAVQFNDRLSIDGFIMTKLDGDARGGAALSIKEVTGKPIKFIGEGEQMDRLKEFRPDGMASRILGFGDIVDVMTDFARVVDEEQAEKNAEDMLSGNFNFHHFLDQINTIQQMGSLTELFDRMPFFSGMSDKVDVDDYELIRIKSIIQSMTEQERLNPDLVNGSKSRQRRIARGAGRDTKDIEDLLQRFNMMQSMMQRLGQNTGWMSKIPGLKQLNSLRQLKNMDLNDVFGNIVQQAASPPPGQQPQQVLPKGLPRGYTPPGVNPQAFARATAAERKSSSKKKKRKLARRRKKKKKR